MMCLEIGHIMRLNYLFWYFSKNCGFIYSEFRSVKKTALLFFGFWNWFLMKFIYEMFCMSPKLGLTILRSFFISMFLSYIFRGRGYFNLFLMKLNTHLIIFAFLVKKYYYSIFLIKRMCFYKIVRNMGILLKIETPGDISIFF